MTQNNSLIARNRSIPQRAGLFAQRQIIQFSKVKPLTRVGAAHRYRAPCGCISFGDCGGCNCTKSSQSKSPAQSLSNYLKTKIHIPSL